MLSRTRAIAGACASVLLTIGCSGDGTALVTVEPPPELECTPAESRRTYQVFFVLDVSGSMTPFLESLAVELRGFAASFPELDAQDNPILVDYYVVAFVNDVRWFPDGLGRRMTSAIAVQAALEQAIEAGASNYNLTVNVFNGDAEENLLDALSEVIAFQPDADAVLVMIATDATFAEAPTVLSTDLPVNSSYEAVYEELSALRVQLHAFTPSGIDGVTRTFKGMPGLITLDGAVRHDLQDLTRSRETLRETLAVIAERSQCDSAP